MTKLSNYYLPTPKRFRKIGDAFLATATFVTAGGLIAFDTLEKIFTPKEIKVTIGIFFALGVLGKFITNLFKSDKPTDQQ